MKLNFSKRMRQLRFSLWKVTHRSECNMLQNVKRGGVICNNCTGAMVLHDFGMRFSSPTVNLYIKIIDYIEFLSHLEYYLSSDFRDITHEEQLKYPVGLLGEKVKVYFMHYKSYEEAVLAWKKRASRIDLNNISVVMVQRKGTTDEQLKQFDNLPYENKVALVNRPMPNIRCAYVIPGFEKEESLGQIIDYVGMFGKRYYDYFPWSKFLLKHK